MKIEMNTPHNRRAGDDSALGGVEGGAESACNHGGCG